MQRTPRRCPESASPLPPTVESAQRAERHLPREWLCPRWSHSPTPHRGRVIRPSSGGGYLHTAVALLSSLAARDHSELCAARWDCDTVHSPNSGGVRKSIIWNFCFFFLLASMLLFSCHLVPFFPCLFWGFCVWQFFSTAGLSFLLPCFCRRGLTQSLAWSCVLWASFSFSVMQSFALLFFLFLPDCCLWCRKTNSPLVGFLLHVDMCCHFLFRTGAVYCRYHSFWFQESQTHVQRWARLGAIRATRKILPSMAKTCFFPVFSSQRACKFFFLISNFSVPSSFLQESVSFKVVIVLTPFLAHPPICFFLPCFSMVEHSLEKIVLVVGTDTDSVHWLVIKWATITRQELLRLWGQYTVSVLPYLFAFSSWPCPFFLTSFLFLWTHHLLLFVILSSLFSLIPLDLALLFFI